MLTHVKKSLTICCPLVPLLPLWVAAASQGSRAPEAITPADAPATRRGAQARAQAPAGRRSAREATSAPVASRVIPSSPSYPSAYATLSDRAGNRPSEVDCGFGITSSTHGFSTSPSALSGSTTTIQRRRCCGTPRRSCPPRRVHGGARSATGRYSDAAIDPSRVRACRLTPGAVRVALASQGGAS